MLQEIDEAAVAVHCRQGPRISIRIDIWILPSDTIRGKGDGNAIYHVPAGNVSKVVTLLFHSSNL